jgi:hypothetical protein
MFSIARRGLTLSVLVIAMMAVVVGSLHADGVFEVPPQWDCTVTQVNPDNTTFDRNPAVNANYVVWQGNDGSDEEIFIQNRSTGVVTQITNNVYGDQNPQIDGAFVVWEFLNPSGGQWDIARYHATTGKTEVISGLNSHDRYPQIEGNTVIWRRTKNGVNTVGIHNIATHVTSKLGYNAGTTHFTPYGISGGKIVYLRTTAAGNASVEVYDIAASSITSVSSGLPFADEKTNPAIYGNVVIWRSKPAGDGNEAFEIYAYNLVTAILIQVTNDNHEDQMPRVYGNDLVFVKALALEQYQVFHYDLQSGTTQLLDEKPMVLDITLNGSMSAWTDDGYLAVYDLSQDKLKTFANIGTYGWLSIYANQVYFASFTGGPNSDIFRADCGFISNEIELPESSASRSVPDALPTQESGLIPLP